MKLVIKNINKLVQTEQTTRKWVAGSDMKTINHLEDAFIEIENGLISNFIGTGRHREYFGYRWEKPSAIIKK